jgi:hypothetical protein
MPCRNSDFVAAFDASINAGKRRSHPRIVDPVKGGVVGLL